MSQTGKKMKLMQKKLGLILDIQVLSKHQGDILNMDIIPRPWPQKSFQKSTLKFFKV